MALDDTDAIALAPDEVARLIIEHADDYAIMIVGRDGRILTWNPGAERITGYSRQEAVGMAFAAIFTPSDQAVGADRFELDKAWRDGRAEDCRWHIRKDGSRFWGNGMTMALRSDRLQALIKVMRDETPNRLADEQRVLLLNELNHRINNTLTIVQSMAEQTLRSANVDPGVREDLAGRLLSLSQAHGALVEQNWAGAELSTLVSRALSPYRTADPHRFIVDGPHVRLSPSQAVSLSLVLHELATNAVKHGALSAEGGEVCVEWNTSEDLRGDRHMSFLWAERGGPAVVKPTRRGFGSRLLQRSFPAGSGGDLTVDYAPEGVRCTIQLNLSSPVEQQMLDVAAAAREAQPAEGAASVPAPSPRG